MSLIVQKFGGSSVADLTKIQKIAELVAAVKKNGDDVVVVVSAMGKTTNQLIEMAHGISVDPHKREMDMLLSTGERITMSLLCIALNERGVAAVSLTGSQAGIITNDRHNDAKVIEVRPFRVQDEIAAGKVVVIGGFQGVSYRRDVTTLGRGGSDTSAVALAAALNAERCEIYSDIDGVYSADPALIKDARHLPEISYQQMQEMSTAGAKVLNAQAVQFAKEANIAIYARATFNREKETVVRKINPGTVSGVKAVVHENDVVRVRLTGGYHQFKTLLSFFRENHIQMKELSYLGAIPLQPGEQVSFVLQVKNIYGWDALRSELEKQFAQAIHFEDALGALSLIGDGLNEDNHVLSETLHLLEENNIPVTGITTTSFRISLLIPRTALQQGVSLCHGKWIN
jgi:aspartate kinase